jgi:diacylglycerol kinase family enzyme
VKAFVIHNPAAIAKRDWPVIAAALKTVFPRFISMASPGRGQAARLVRDALREGHAEIVAVGGDGLFNEVVNGFFEHGVQVSPDAVLSLVPTTQGDIGFSHEHGVAAALQLARTQAVTLDLGHVSCLTPEGAAVTRFFLGSASFGITADIARRINRARIAALAGPAFTRAYAETLALARWRACHVRLMADHGQDEIDGIAAVGVLNGVSFGGGLKAVPDADPTDGRFDIAVVGGGRGSMIRHTLKRLRGGDEKCIRHLRSTRLTAAPTLETRRPVPVETDGEAIGMLPASFEIVPNAIKIRL